MIRRRSTPRHSFYSRFTAHHCTISLRAHAGNAANPFFSSDYFITRGYPGVGGRPPLSANSVPSALKSIRSPTPTDLSDTHHYPPATIPFRVRTSAKRARNSCRIRSFKTQDLKLFRMNSCRKTGEGAPAIRSKCHANRSSRTGTPACQLFVACAIQRSKEGSYSSPNCATQHQTFDLTTTELQL
jgi:hypothetical protein